MKRNEDWPEGSRVLWVEGGELRKGVVCLQTGLRTSVIESGDSATTSFDPDGRDLIDANALPFVFRYTNHRGETAVRQVIPLGTWFGTTEHHPAPCWLLRAWCLDRKAVRDFDLLRALLGVRETA